MNSAPRFVAWSVLRPVPGAMCVGPKSFSLPPTVDQTKLTAEHRNGVLTVRLPLREEAKPRQIKVDVAE